MEQTATETNDKSPQGVSNTGFVAESNEIEEINQQGKLDIKSDNNEGGDQRKLVNACCTAPTKKGVLAFLKKYFLEGQKLRDSVQQQNKSAEPDLPWWKRVVNSRKFWAILLPFLFWEVIWWTLAVRHNFFQYFPDKYKMSITMMFGATVAG